MLKQAVHSNATLYGKKNSSYIPIFYNLVVEDGRYIIMIIECLKSASNTRFSIKAQFRSKSTVFHHIFSGKVLLRFMSEREKKFTPLRESRTTPKTDKANY